MGALRILFEVANQPESTEQAVACRNALIRWYDEKHNDSHTQFDLLPDLGGDHGRTRAIVTCRLPPGGLHEKRTNPAYNLGSYILDNGDPKAQIDA